MDPNQMTMLLAILLLLAFSAYFSASETAFTSLNRVRLRTRAEGGDRRAAQALDLAQDYDRLLTTILIGNNVVNIAATTLSTALFIDLLGSANGPAVSTLVLTVAVLIFGEVSPKSLAKERSESFAMLSAPVMSLLVRLLSPLSALFALLKRGLSRLFHTADEQGITEEELVTMVDQAESEGGLDEHESELIRSAIEFGDRSVREILTPRVDITAVSDSDSLDQVAARFAETGYSRLPVYHGDVDNIIGVLHEKDFHAGRYHGREELKDLVAPVLYTTGNTGIAQLLRLLQQSKAHMAIVVDEFGGTEGLCTLEDIVEELVGEIWDEHDEVIEQFQKQPDGSYLISCAAALDDLCDLFSLQGEQDATTVSGWVMEQLGRVPQVGDSFTAEGLEVNVTRMDHHRLLEIRVVPVAEPGSFPSPDTP